MSSGGATRPPRLPLRRPLLLLKLALLLTRAADRPSDRGEEMESAAAISPGLTSPAVVYIGAEQSHILSCSRYSDQLDGGIVSWVINGDDAALMPGWILRRVDNDTLVVEALASGNGTDGNLSAHAATLQCIVKGPGGQGIIGQPLRLVRAAAGLLRLRIQRTAAAGGSHSPESIASGSMVALTCTPESLWIPKPNRYLWYKNDTLLSSSVRVAILTTGILIISNVSLVDSGSYRCSAAASQFNRTLTAWIQSSTLWLRVGAATAKDTIDQSPVENNTMKIINKPPRLVRAIEGDAVVLTCIVERLQTSFATWWGKKGQADNCLGQETKYMSIDNVKASDSGNYTCVVCRYFGDTRAIRISNTHLEVIARPRLQVSWSVEEKDVGATRQIGMRCLPESPPCREACHITWFKNAVRVTSNSLVKLTPSRQLVLSSVERSHSGMYQCLVENPAGVAGHTFNVTIAEPDSDQDREAAALYLRPTLLSVKPVSCYEDSRLTVTWAVHFDDKQEVMASTVKYAQVDSRGAQRSMEKAVPMKSCRESCSDLVVRADLGSRPTVINVAVAAGRRCARCRTHLDQLLPGTKYTVQVMLLESRGLGAISQPLEVTTASAPQHLPVRVKTLGMSALLFEWSHPMNSNVIESYNLAIQLKTSDDAPVITQKVFRVRRQFHLVKGLKPGDSYKFSVVAEHSSASCIETFWISGILKNGASRNGLTPPKLTVTAHNATAVFASWTLSDFDTSVTTAEVTLYYEVASGQYGPFQYAGSGSQRIDVTESSWCDVTVVAAAGEASAIATARYEGGSPCAVAHAAVNLTAKWLNANAAVFSWIPGDVGCCNTEQAIARRIRNVWGTFDVSEPLTCNVPDTSKKAIIQPLIPFAVYDWMVLTWLKGAVAPPIASSAAIYGHSSVPMPRNLAITAKMQVKRDGSQAEQAWIELTWLEPVADTNIHIDYYVIAIQSAEYFYSISNRSYHATSTSINVTQIESGQTYIIAVSAVANTKDVSAPLRGVVIIPCSPQSNCSDFKRKPTYLVDISPTQERNKTIAYGRKKGLLLGILIAVSCIGLTAIVVCLLFVLMKLKKPRKPGYTQPMKLQTYRSPRRSEDSIAQRHLSAQYQARWLKIVHIVDSTTGRAVVDTEISGYHSEPT